jgi:hypothetical protein
MCLPGPLGGGFAFRKVEIDAYEIDATLRQHLSATLASYAGHLPVGWQVLADDFIEAAALQSMAPRRFTNAILNPPYKKISSLSAHRLILRQAGIETVNLYSAFVAMALSLMKDSGQLVAIIPRSFSNGPYYRPFREFLLQRTALRHIHLFASRNKALKDDDVLQENIIIRVQCGGVRGPVTVSHSTDDSFSDLVEHEHSLDRIVFPSDPESFIHVPTSPGRNTIELSNGVRSSFADLGIRISTGPVVDFRLRDYSRTNRSRALCPCSIPATLPGRRRNGRRKDKNAVMR